MDSTGSALLLKVRARDNKLLALRRGRANKGAAAVEGLGIDEATEHLKTAWFSLRNHLLTGAYRPSPVRQDLIPKSVGGERQLGISTVTDRIIHQALLQILQSRLTPISVLTATVFVPAAAPI